MVGEDAAGAAVLAQAAGDGIDTAAVLRRGTRALLQLQPPGPQGPEVVALAVPGEGDLGVWRDGDVLLPLTAEVVDPTGADLDPAVLDPR